MNIIKFLIAAIIAMTTICCPINAAAQITTDKEIGNLPVDKIVVVAQAILATPLEGNEEVVKNYSTVILLWLTNSHDMTLSIRPNVPAGNSNANILMAYMSAEIINMADRGLTQNDESTYIASMKDVLKYYKANRKALGKIKAYDKLDRLSSEKLDKELAKMYDAK